MRRILETGTPPQARVIYRRRIGGAVVMIGLLMCAALAVAAWSHDKAVRATADARHQRTDTFNGQEAVIAFWREREAMGEFLAFHRESYRSEVLLHRLRFRAALGRVGATSPTPAERTQIRLANGANERMIAVFDALPSAANDRTDDNGEHILQAAEISVLRPIGQLTSSNRLDYLRADTRAASAEQGAFRSEIVTSLLGLAAVIWFAIFATRLVRRIGNQNAKLVLADAAKDEFISTVSHELRTPLTSMHGFLEMLLDDPDDPLSDQQRGFVTTVQRGSVRLERLVNDLLLTAQLRAGPLNVRTTNTDLVQITRHSVADAQAYATQKALQLIIEVPSAPLLVEADAVRLGQAVDNLISNAVKFTPEGGRVTVTVVRDGERVTLTVSDTGMGMTAAEIKRLFEPFFRTDSAQIKQIQGTGLGLPIVKAIVDAHHGTIEIASEPNVGTEFSVTLPLALPHRTRADDSDVKHLIAA